MKKQPTKKTETPVSVRIPLELLKRLDALAAKEKRSRSNMILLFIEMGVDHNQSIE
jgi:metal-responsive CopG/Arc/MetJ family transcriptional regulator